MKRLGIAALVIGAPVAAASAATIDECRTITNKMARLDCYDNLSSGPSSIGVEVTKTTPRAAPERKDLSGFYIGGTLGFGSSSKIDTPSYNYRQGYSDFESFRANSPTMGVSVGYNAFSGSTLFGLQLDVTGDLSSEKQSYNHPTYTLDYANQFGWSSGYHGQRPGTVFEYENTNVTKHSEATSFYKYQGKIAPTLSVRFGQQFDSFLVYGRVGAGISRIKETFGYDNTKSVYCGTTTNEIRYISETYAEYWTTGCNDQYNGTITSSSRTITRPTATLAVGAEYHFDRYFTRLEGEMRHTFLDEKLDFSPSNGLTQYKVNTGIGIRF